MMKKTRLINAALAAVLLTSFVTHAQWLTKVDDTPANKLEASLSRRNAQAVEVGTDDAEKITAVLKQLQNAKSKILVGIQTQDGGNQSSFSGNASGSTAATNSFIKACEISL